MLIAAGLPAIEAEASATGSINDLSMMAHDHRNSGSQPECASSNSSTIRQI
jgi:hypothetical protein